MRQSKIYIFAYLFLGSVVLSSVYGVGKAMADSDFEYREHERKHKYREHEHEHEREYRETGKLRDNRNFTRATSNMYPQYVEECGSCHMAYPPQLLPVPSWVTIMSGLDDHFGENAELDESTRVSIQQYLIDISSSMDYRRLLRNASNRIPTRITELPFFIRKHDEIPSRYIRGNVKVGSLSQCNACHRGAERGNFDEDNVSIPGVGRWD